MDNNIKKNQSLVIPIISIAAFMLLIFGAGYAYFDGTGTMNTAYGNITTPARQSLTCTKTDAYVVVTREAMYKNKAGTIAGNANGTLICTCAGGTGSTCGFTISVSNVTHAISAGEATVDITDSNSKCTAKTNNTVNATTTCSLGAGTSTTITAAVHFWNINGDQSAKANANVAFNVAAKSPTFS